MLRGVALMDMLDVSGPSIQRQAPQASAPVRCVSGDNNGTAQGKKTAKQIHVVNGTAFSLRSLPKSKKPEPWGGALTRL